MTVNRKNYFIPYFSIVLCLFLFSEVSFGKALFEGYYKLELNKKHVGYVIQRYEFLKKTQQYQSTYYVKFNINETYKTESVKAITSKDFKPVSFQFTSQEVGADKKNFVTIIDAKFKKLKMTSVVTKGVIKKGIKLPKKTYALKIKPDTILSTFLNHKILAAGLKAKMNYSYIAIAEEDGNQYSGSARTIGRDKIEGKDVFRISNNFKNDVFISLMDGFGHVFKFESPDLKLVGTLVRSPEEATRALPMDKKSIKALFGNIPTGKHNNLVKK